MGKIAPRLKIVNSRTVIFASFVIIAIAAAWIWPTFVSSQTKIDRLSKNSLQNFDIRQAQNKTAREKLIRKLGNRGETDQDSLQVTERKMKEAESRLKAKTRGVEIQPSSLTNGPEIVGVLTSKQMLTGKSSAASEQIVRGFLTGNSDLYGLTRQQIASLKTVADYENPSGNLSWVELEQKIGRIPVFQGNLRAALTSDGELVRTTGLLVPGLDYDAIKAASAGLTSKMSNGGANAGGDDPGLAAEAAAAIASGGNSIGVSVNPADLELVSASEDGLSYVFARGPFADETKVDLVYFPLESGDVILSWSMTLWQDVPAFYTLVDAESGDLLWRKNITEDQTQSATYSVYNDDSPAPLSPSNASPGANVQAAAIPRTTFNLISEHPSNNLGWLIDGATTTTGNNVDAGLDIVAPNGIDVGGRPVSATRNFSYDYNPAPGLLGGIGSSNPTDTNFRWGAVTNIFFWTNRFHDRLYEVGFTEAARNFQQDNFGRNPGGLTANARNGVDRVLAEAQDYSGTNNANFSTPADGSSGRMQMYVWPGPSPARDGDLDNDIVIHELAHGLSNRLHNNASGLNITVSRGMGEGWSDFYARALLATADEDVEGLFTVGGYATYFVSGTTYTDNYYYGIRRFPLAVKTNVGPNGKPHNPLTFADIDPNTISLTDGAYPRGIFGTGGRAGAIAVHNIGEVWASGLNEVRARIIQRMGFAAGNQRMLQLVTDGMKLDPVNPTLIQARNSLLAADVAFGSEDALDIWEGFATRGMGFNTGEAVNSVQQQVVESFDNPIPGMLPVTVNDDACNANGVADAGEKVTLSVPLHNPLSQTITNVSAQVTGGGSAIYGTINPGQTVSMDISYQVPPAAEKGSVVKVNVVVDSNLGQETKTFDLPTGTSVAVFSQNFDGAAAPALPAGWTTSTVGSQPLWTTSAAASVSPPNSASTTFAATTGINELVTPSVAIPATGNSQLTFRHSFNTEHAWDGGVLEISIDGGAYTDVLDAGGVFTSFGYNWVLNNTAGGNTNALQNRAAWTGSTSNTFFTTTLNLPASAKGKNVRFRFRAGSDSAITVTGSHWRIDNVAINNFQSAALTTTTTAAAAAGQYSDQTTLKATVASACDYPAGTMEFRVAGVLVGSVPVNGAGEYSLAYTITNAPGNHSITANFVSSNPYFANSNGSNTLAVSQENASVAFPNSNPLSVKVNAPGGKAGPITFCADISEVPDGSAGNTTNATASFDFSPVAGGSSPSPGVVTYSGGGVGGTRTACVTLNNVNVDLYDVTVTVGGYYVGTGSSVLAVYDPSLGFVTGGGTVINNGYIANFGINVKYLKNGKPQGSMIYIEHRPTGPLKVKSNSMQSLSIVGNTAVILSKATLDGVGNYDFRVTAVDNGEPGSSDRFGIQVNAPGGAVVPGLSFGPVTLRGGNIQVPK